jgi:subtilisin family serine protease
VNLVLGARKKFPETDDKYKPVKIAVIDTGVDPNHRQAGKFRYKDFVDGTDVENLVEKGMENVNEKATAKKDNTGHGTISVELILKVYEKAELYVARVFEKDQADEKKEPQLMAKASSLSLSVPIRR